MTRYVGARYMPKFMGEYDPTTAYEALSVVDNGMGTSYISNKPTPANTPLTDRTYWEVYGSTSGAIINLQNQIDDIDADVINLKAYDKTINTIDFSQKNVLFVGDSYGDESVLGYTCYPSYVANFLKIGTWQNLCVGGAGFYSPDPDLKYLHQLEAYTGNRDSITDIYILGGINDSKATTPSDTFYTLTLTEMSALDTYVSTNYPNAKITYGYIGNMLDSLVLSTSPSDPRIYTARKVAMQILTERAIALNWRILNDTAAILSVDKDFIASDGIHPSASGQVQLARGIACAILSNSANVQLFDISVFQSATYSLDSGNHGTAIMSINNRVANLNFQEIIFKAEANVSIGANSLVVTLSRAYFNKEIKTTGFVRLESTDIGDCIIPAFFIFKDDTMRVEMLGIFNSGAATTYHINFTAGASGSLIHIMPFTLSFDSAALG